MENDYDRAYRMALGVHHWGFTHESEEAFASRIADIGAERGLQAAAQAISDLCNENGLRMSPRRILKSLAIDESKMAARRGGGFASVAGPNPLVPKPERNLNYERPAEYHERETAKRKAEEMRFAIGCWLVVAVIAVLVWQLVF